MSKRFQYSLLLVAIVATISACSSSKNQSATTTATPESISVDKIVEKEFGTRDHDSTCITPELWDIITGNSDAYLDFRMVYNDPDYGQQLSCAMQQKMLLYAFIMAEVYRDTIAAYDFAEHFELMGMEPDSLLGQKVVCCWEMVSKSKPSIASFTAARELVHIYRDGLNGMKQDLEKAEKYQHLADSIRYEIRIRR